MSALSLLVELFVRRRGVLEEVDDVDLVGADIGLRVEAKMNSFDESIADLSLLMLIASSALLSPRLSSMAFRSLTCFGHLALPGLLRLPWRLPRPGPVLVVLCLQELLHAYHAVFGLGTQLEDLVHIRYHDWWAVGQPTAPLEPKNDPSVVRAATFDPVSAWRSGMNCGFPQAAATLPDMNVILRIRCVPPSETAAVAPDAL